MDLSKAFDCTDHQIMLCKLERAGIRGTALKLLSSDLSNRKITVNVNGTHSTLEDITIGVPRGSILAPILYLIYTNDMARLSLKGELRQFADDSATLYASRAVQTNNGRVKNDMESTFA